MCSRQDQAGTQIGSFLLVALFGSAGPALADHEGKWWEHECSRVPTSVPTGIDPAGPNQCQSEPTKYDSLLSSTVGISLAIHLALYEERNIA